MKSLMAELTERDPRLLGILSEVHQVFGKRERKIRLLETNSTTHPDKGTGTVSGRGGMVDTSDEV